MITILCLVGLYGAYKKLESGINPIESGLQAIGMFCLAMMPFLT